MIGYLNYIQGEKGKGHAALRDCKGRLLMWTEIPEGRRLTGRRNARKLARAIAAQSVTRAIYPEAFPYGDIFLQQGILPYESLYLYEKMATILLRSRLADSVPERATVAVVGESLTAAAEEMVRELAVSVRYLMVDLGGEEQDLCHALRREYGIAIMNAPSRQQLMRADGILELSPGRIGTWYRGVCLRIYDGPRVLHSNGVSFGLPPKIREIFGETADKEQLLSFCLREDLVMPYQIPLKWLTMEEKNNIMQSL